MPDVFHSPRLTLERAKHHINDFESMATDFINSRPWTERTEIKSKPRLEIHKIVFTSEPPEMLACILADAANNLRSVLDQCGYAAATCSDKPTKHISFPFSETKPNFKNRAKGCCTDLPWRSNAFSGIPRLTKLGIRPFGP